MKTSAFWFSLVGVSAAGVPEEYLLTNISAWTEAQLAVLPHFDHYIPLQPAAATRAQPRRIDDLGRIVVNLSNETESHPFLRLADGSFTPP